MTIYFSNVLFRVFHHQTLLDPCFNYFFVRLINWLIILIDYFIDILFKYSFRFGSRSERQKSDEYEHSAQIVNVLHRGSLFPMEHQTLDNFIIYHQSYTHPEMALSNDNITLMGLNKHNSCLTPLK